MKAFGCDVEELIKTSYTSSGRFARREFAVLYLFWFGLFVVLLIFAAILEEVSEFLGAILAIVIIIVWIAAGVSVLVAGIRRLHDLGKTGWLLLLVLVPIANMIMLIIFFFVKGKPVGETKWG